MALTTGFKRLLTIIAVVAVVGGGGWYANKTGLIDEVRAKATETPTNISVPDTSQAVVRPYAPEPKAAVAPVPAATYATPEPAQRPSVGPEESKLDSAIRSKMKGL